MRRRWHDLVIALSIVALAAVGVWTIWGGDLVRLFRPAAPPSAETGAPDTAARPEPVAPPPGQAAGPF